MTTVPKRLVAISAAIPTGETCDGCQFARGKSVRTNGPTVCWDPTIHPDGPQERPVDWHSITQGKRLPECKARDRFLVIEPGSAVGGLVRAAVRYGTSTYGNCASYSALFDMRENAKDAAEYPAVRAWVEANK